MKVLFATYPMAFHTPGGGEIQLLAYERHLAAAGVEVTRFDPWNPRFLEHDLVHFFSCIGGSSHFCSFVKQLGLPLIISSSLWITEETAGNFPVDEIRHQLSLADRIVTNSATESETLARLLRLNAERFAVVHNGVERRFLNRADPTLFRARYGIDGDFVLCVGNVEPRKNQLRLAEALRQVGDLPLVLIGGVRDQAYLATVRATSGAGFRYIDPIAHDSPLLASAYAAARVFALPSLFETPGLAALEAAAQGAPVVITREGSTCEYFGMVAYYADPLSVDSIATALHAALAVPPSDAPQFVPPTWDTAAAELNAVYDDVLYEAGRGGHLRGTADG